MCNANCLAFGQNCLNPGEVKGKRIIEVGAYDVNGSLRSVLEPMELAEYVGVDIVKGCGVDMVCPAEEVLTRFGHQSFDVVVSTELLEHVLDWRKVISNLKNVCAPGGVVILTTRSKGFDYHGWPYDFWRFEKTDMERIFADFEIEKIESDDMGPGVFIKARRPADFHEQDLSGYEVYSIVDGRRVAGIDKQVLADFTRKHEKEFRLLERLTLRSRFRKTVRDIRWRMKQLTR